MALSHFIYVLFILYLFVSQWRGSCILFSIRIKGGGASHCSKVLFLCVISLGKEDRKGGFGIEMRVVY